MGGPLDYGHPYKPLFDVLNLAIGETKQNEE
jgi:hypothetical protein